MLNKVMTCEGIWQEALKNKFEEADADMLKLHHKSQVDRAKLDMENFLRSMQKGISLKERRSIGTCLCNCKQFVVCLGRA